MCYQIFFFFFSFGLDDVKLTIVILMLLQIVDLATLTGACIVALGPKIAGNDFKKLLLINLIKTTHQVSKINRYLHTE